MIKPARRKSAVRPKVKVPRKKDFTLNAAMYEKEIEDRDKAIEFLFGLLEEWLGSRIKDESVLTELVERTREVLKK